MIETFDDFLKAVYWLESKAYDPEYFKAEIYRTPDFRWRVGIITDAQLELDLEGTRDNE